MYVHVLETEKITHQTTSDSHMFCTLNDIYYFYSRNHFIIFYNILLLQNISCVLTLPADNTICTVISIMNALQTYM